MSVIQQGATTFKTGQITNNLPYPYYFTAVQVSGPINWPVIPGLNPDNGFVPSYTPSGIASPAQTATDYSDGFCQVTYLSSRSLFDRALVSVYNGDFRIFLTGDTRDEQCGQSLHMPNSRYLFGREEDILRTTLFAALIGKGTLGSWTAMKGKTKKQLLELAEARLINPQTPVRLTESEAFRLISTGCSGQHVFEAGAASWNAYAKFPKKAPNAAYPQVPAAVVIALDGAFYTAGLALDPDSWKRRYYMQ